MAGHDSMVFANVAVSATGTSAYHPEGNGGAETVGFSSGVKDQPLNNRLTDDSVCNLVAVSWGYSSAASRVIVYHGDGRPAFSMGKAADSVMMTPDLGPEGLRLLGEWYVEFTVGATIAATLLFDIESQ